MPAQPAEPDLIFPCALPSHRGIFRVGDKSSSIKLSRFAVERHLNEPVQSPRGCSCGGEVKGGRQRPLAGLVHQEGDILYDHPGLRPRILEAHAPELFLDARHR